MEAQLAELRADRDHWRDLALDLFAAFNRRSGFLRRRRGDALPMLLQAVAGEAARRLERQVAIDTRRNRGKVRA